MAVDTRVKRASALDFRTPAPPAGIGGAGVDAADRADNLMLYAGFWSGVGIEIVDIDFAIGSRADLVLDTTRTLDEDVEITTGLDFFLER